MIKPHGRNALITGAGKRIGRVIAEALAADGWGVCVHYHSSSGAAARVVAKIEEKGGRAVAICADLADEAAVLDLVPAAGRALGRLSLLVNNASRFERDGALTATRESWDAHMETNLRAPFVLTQAFAGQVAGGQAASVINIIDQRVWNPTPHFTSYTLSKAGLWTLTRTMAMALAPEIRVNAIGPGPTLPSSRQTAAEFERQWRAVPLARPVDPGEIAAAVRFILDAPSMTGQMIVIDSGQHLAGALG
jgi:NAD(P)-dependent dehydrogenase (short-subunit alcohol dehydrogenase family)